MRINYFNLPFGAQILIWTSRVMMNGSCRTFPNKYQLVNIAYNKVGILSGDKLLKKILATLKDNKSFNLQRVNVQNLNHNEINIINCIEDYKKEKFYSNHYLEVWDLEDKKSDFILASKNLAFAFKEASLDTDIDSSYLNTDANYEDRFITKTLH